jgi:hypothetical protein
MGTVYGGRNVDDSTRWTIGQTKNTAVRSKQHLRSNPSLIFPLKFQTDTPKQFEGYMHHHFESRRVPGTTEWFFVTQDELIEVSDQAQRYCLNVRPLKKEAALLKSQESVCEPLPADPDTVTRYTRLKEIDSLMYPLECERDRIRYELMIHIGLHKGVDGYITWKSHTKEGLDQERFKAEHPELYKKYCRIAMERKFILL